MVSTPLFASDRGVNAMPASVAMHRAVEAHWLMVLMLVTAPFSPMYSVPFRKVRDAAPPWSDVRATLDIAWVAARLALRGWVPGRTPPPLGVVKYRSPPPFSAAPAGRLPRCGAVTLSRVGLPNLLV